MSVILTLLALCDFDMRRLRRSLTYLLTYLHGVALVQIYDAGLKRAARGLLKIQDAKIRHLGTIAQLCWAIS